MTVCSYFLQGRCRYGDKCWNEHPRGGGGGGGGGGGYRSNSYNRSTAQQQPKQGSGGFGNRVWVNPSQQKGGYIQQSSFSSHGGSNWGQGNGGSRDVPKASNFSFSAQNKFSALSSPSDFGRGGREDGRHVANDDEDVNRKLEIIQSDMEIWEKSGQWCFSCYSSTKTPLSGFTDHSPEEIRLEYYSAKASGDLQGYLNGVNQLATQWRNRVLELKHMNPSTRAALIAELNNPAPQTSAGGFASAAAPRFGSSTSSFENKGFGGSTPVQASTFSFAAGSNGFGSSAAPSSSLGFGDSSVVPTQAPSGFGSAAPSAVSAASLSFSAPTSSTPAAASGFGSASGFSFSSASTSVGSGFGTLFGAKPSTAPGSSSIFGQAISGFGTGSTPGAVSDSSANGMSDHLFSVESKLTPEELSQFKAKSFTLGCIPLKPPPANLLMI